MEQQFTMEPSTAEQFEKIVNKLANTNYDQGFRNKIAEKMAAGIKEFIVAADQPLRFGGDKLEIQVIIGTAKNDPTKSVLKAIDAALTKEIKIPPVVLQDQGAGNVLVHLPQLDERLAHPPSSKTLGPGLHDELGAMKKKYVEEINRDLQILMQKAPDLFNLIQAKHNFPVNFTVPPEYLSQQATIVASSYIHNTFSTYYNLTPIEIYGMLKNELPVYKKLFTTGQSDPSGMQQPSQQFEKWVKVNFDKRRPDGSFVIDFLPVKKSASLADTLKKYNFLELDSDLGWNNINYYLKKGALIEVTNNNPVGEKKVLIGADPGPQMRIKIFSPDGTIIYNHNDYLKQGLKKEITDVIKLPLVDYRRQNRTSTADPKEQPVHIKTVLVNMSATDAQSTTNSHQEPAKKNRGNRQVKENDSQQKRAI